MSVFSVFSRDLVYEEEISMEMVGTTRLHLNSFLPIEIGLIQILMLTLTLTLNLDPNPDPKSEGITHTHTEIYPNPKLILPHSKCCQVVSRFPNA